MRESWTDERLDYLNQKVDDGFAHVDERIGRFEKHVDERFDAMHRLIIQGGLGLFGALFVACLTALATHL